MVPLVESTKIKSGAPIAKHPEIKGFHPVGLFMTLIYALYRFFRPSVIQNTP